MRGAGGTSGGLGEFLLGFVMFCGGGYLLLDSIRVDTGFGWGGALFHAGGVGVTSGMLLLPFALGVAMVFYSARNVIGWLLAGGSLVALVVGVVARVQLRLTHMSAFDLIVIIVLFVGGVGLLARGLRDHGEDERPRAR